MYSVQLKSLQLFNVQVPISLLLNSILVNHFSMFPSFDILNYMPSMDYQHIFNGMMYYSSLEIIIHILCFLANMYRSRSMFNWNQSSTWNSLSESTIFNWNNIYCEEMWNIKWWLEYSMLYSKCITTDFFEIKCDYERNECRISTWRKVRKECVDRIFFWMYLVSFN